MVHPQIQNMHSAILFSKAHPWPYCQIHPHTTLLIILHTMIVLLHTCSLLYLSTEMCIAPRVLHFSAINNSSSCRKKYSTLLPLLLILKTAAIKSPRKSGRGMPCWLDASTSNSGTGRHGYHTLYCSMKVLNGPQDGIPVNP